MKRVLSALPLFVGAFAALCLASTTARADGIVFAGPDPCFPAGAGRGCGPNRAPHVLSIQSQGSSTSAAGAVARSASGDVGTGDWQRGSNTQTIALSELGLTNASSLAIYYDINEPNGGGRSTVTLNTLVLTAYDAAGNSVFSASLVGGPLPLQTLGSGQGHSDYVFLLDAAAAARLQAAMDANPNLLLGLSASVSNAEGGPESFFLGTRAGAPSNPVPEPATMVLLGTGLVGIAAKVRRRRKAARE